MNLPSSSELARAFACGASRVLPRVEEATSEAATRGTIVHKYLQRANEVGVDVALSELDEAGVAPDMVLFCERIPMGELPAGGTAEQSFAWHPLTDVARVTGKGRAYSAVDRRVEFVGTADYAGVDATGECVVIVDFKTGRDCGPPSESWQLRSLALFAARAAGVDSARVSLGYIRDGVVIWARAEFDAMDLASFADELRGLASEVPSATDVREGEHCAFCPCFDACPAKVSLARAVGSGTALSGIEARVEAMTNAELGEVYLKLDAYDAVSERVRKKIRERADAEPVDLGDGRELGTVQWPCTVVDADLAHATIAAMKGAEVADAAVPRKATISAVRKLGKDVEAAVEQARGISVVMSAQVRVHKSKKKVR